MIRLIHVNKYFNRKKSNEIHVINETSLWNWGDKGLVTFLGSSGCGKTTLLNAIGGLDKVDGGDIYIDDEEDYDQVQLQKDEIGNSYVGYIFQNYNLIEDRDGFRQRGAGAEDDGRQRQGGDRRAGHVYPEEGRH